MTEIRVVTGAWIWTMFVSGAAITMLGMTSIMCSRNSVQAMHTGLFDAHDGAVSSLWARDMILRRRFFCRNVSWIDRIDGRLFFFVNFLFAWWGIKWGRGTYTWDAGVNGSGHTSRVSCGNSKLFTILVGIVQIHAYDLWTLHLWLWEFTAAST